MNKRGHCPVCKRDDVNLVGDKCWRCWDRKRRGVDVLTGLAAAAPAADVASEPVPPPFTPETPAEPATELIEPVRPPRTKRKAPDVFPESVTLEFTTPRDANLLHSLLQDAMINRRTLENEILCQLEDACISSHSFTSSEGLT